MPELKPLPCPACGSTWVMANTSPSGADIVQCCNCYMHGPLCDTEEYTIERWNSLPRALRWTNEPPKVAGWYWRSFKCGWLGNRWDEPSVVFVPGSNIGRFRGGKEVRWAGPIPLPLEG